MGLRDILCKWFGHKWSLASEHPVEGLTYECRRCGEVEHDLVADLEVVVASAAVGAWCRAVPEMDRMFEKHPDLRREVVARVISTARAHTNPKLRAWQRSVVSPQNTPKR